MTDFPRELHYTDTHEWVRLESDDTISIGITDFAQQQLGDIVFVELPEKGLSVEKGNELAVIESVKTAADMYAPIAGDVIDMNHQLNEQPDLVNEDPYGNGWICRMKPEQLDDLDQLMDADDYQAMISKD
ncbi:MAG TPA: glycine cleavage system protein GcvH [Coxiellaceae bacterium]|nr:glycine cleavage system protein GcvH [Coxiellaceae bacterium]